jgi:hypothetical protein
MAIQEYSPIDPTRPVEVTIWPVENVEPLHKHMDVRATEFYASLGDRAIGLVHWEAGSDDNFGYIDGIDPHEGIDIENITYDEWEAIAIAMHAIVKKLQDRHISLVEFPGGSRAFLQAL